MIRFNQTWRLTKPLPFMAEALPDTKVRDVTVSAISKHLPQYEAIVQSLLAMLPQKRYSLVTISAERLSQGQGSCVDTSWHLDGKMDATSPEHYALVCFADDGNRTLFCDEQVIGWINKTPESIEERRALFGGLLKRDLHCESGGIEIPNATPVIYSTFDFHKGRNVQYAGRRVLVRVMTSDLIRPKPFSLR
ncbi:hypothetical protein [Rheinheimera sp.]|uniref:hypothetical protein n=1 Tax=Rheinheimera sp. TaxID=1869214 RepID=UPI00404781BE